MLVSIGLQFVFIIITIMCIVLHLSNKKYSLRIHDLSAYLSKDTCRKKLETVYTHGKKV